MHEQQDSVRKTVRTERLALLALIAGGIGIGFAPLFVRWSDLGPAATGFYRMAFAVPLLLFLADWEERRSGRFVPPARGRTRWLLVVAGAFFAADLAFWHWSIHATTVANATILTNLAPVWVVIAAALLFSERPTPLFLVGLVLALAGAALLVGASFRVDKARVVGDLLGIASGLFYAGYQLAIKRVRATRPTLAVMTASTAVTGLGLFVIALVAHEPLLAPSWRAWGILVALALVSQVAGQGLIAYGLAHVPSGFSSVTLLVQPLVAALAAWWLLAEPLGPLQGLGAAVVVAGIVLARVGTPRRGPPVPMRT